MIAQDKLDQNLQEQPEIDRPFSLLHRKRDSYKFIQDLNKNIQHIRTSCQSRFGDLDETSKKDWEKQRKPQKLQKNLINLKNRKKMTIQKKIKTIPLNGEGVIKLSNGNVVFATWENDLIKGDAKIVYPSGDKYIGRVQGYKRHGQGSLLLKNGECYKGNFIDGSLEGFGILSNAYGSVLKKGIWRKGKLHAKDQIW